MAEPKYMWICPDSYEYEVRGTDDDPIIVSRPYWVRHLIKYPTYSAAHWFGKRKSTFTFWSDDIEIAMKIIRAGGDIKDVCKGLATNAIWAEPLMRHVEKLIVKEDKKNKKNVKESKKIIKKDKKTVKKVKETVNNVKVNKSEFNRNLNTNMDIKLNNWM